MKPYEIAHLIELDELPARSMRRLRMTAAVLTFVGWAGSLYIAVWLLWFIVGMVGAQ